MHSYVTGWMNFWRNRRWLFGALLLALLATGIFLASHIELTNDIRDTLPEDSGLTDIIEQVEIADKEHILYVALDAESGSGDTTWGHFEREIAQYIEGPAEPAMSRMAEPASMYERTPYLLLPEDYEYLDSLITSSDPGVTVDEAISLLSRPESWVSRIGFNKDPYGVTSLAYRQLEGIRALSPYEVTSAGLELADGREVRSYALRTFDDRGRYVDLLNTLEETEAAIEDEGAQLDYFSPLLIEAANVRQIQRDLRWTMMIVLVCILSLLIIVYRDWLTPVLFLIPGALGLLFALALLGAFSPQLSLIAIGSAAVIFGIVLDYSFHFFTHYRDSGSLEVAIREVSAPLLTSCLTTVLAFGLLQFTSSPILKDFGAFAAISLIGAALSVLFVMPVFLPRQVKSIESKQRFSGLDLRKYNWIIIGVVTVITVMFGMQLRHASFDGNLFNLNFHPEWLKQAESTFTGVDPDLERRLILHTEQATDAQLAAAIDVLDELRTEGSVQGYFLQDVINPNAQKAQARRSQWLSFWESHTDETAALQSTAIARGFKEDAFDQFFDWTLRVDDLDPSESLSFVIVPVSDRETVSSQLAALPGVEVVDLGSQWQTLISDVRDNFNLILFGTAILVFVILLIVYGRIELALVTFLPMALAWIWIVGAAAILDVKFNFINIILSTFIFGLGDDFAIFMTSAHLEKYRTGKGSLNSHRRAIFLSATTTLIGMGVLLTARHPALFSLAGLSVLGIATIMLISLVVQPAMIRLLITERTKRGKPPMTLPEFIMSVHCFGLFAILSILASILQLVLRIIPLPRRRKAKWLRTVLCYGCRIILGTNLITRFRYVNSENLDFSRPSIIVANHQSFVDILQMVSLSPNLIILTKKWVYYSPLFGAAVRYAGYLYTDHGVEENDRRVKELIEDGCSIMIFPEGTRTPEGSFRRWQKGALFMSENYHLDISPVVLHGYGWVVPKGNFTFQRGVLSVVALPRIAWDDPTHGTGYRERTKKISRYFRQAYYDYDRESARTDYHFGPMLSNFIYKGPIIEWYFRVKWRLEKSNYDRIDDLLVRDGKVYDLGCGMGYTSLYLHRRAQGREIMGIDYDAEKILIAQNHYLRGDNLQFEERDLRAVELEQNDGILLGDVLHYMPFEDQESLLEKCAKSLKPGGSIIIRDGIRSGRDHKRTRRSEFWSTRVIKFNKTVGELHFFDMEFLHSFAARHNLQLDVPWRSESTSNMLCVLYRN